MVVTVSVISYDFPSFIFSDNACFEFAHYTCESAFVGIVIVSTWVQCCARLLGAAALVLRIATHCFFCTCVLDKLAAVVCCWFSILF